MNIKYKQEDSLSMGERDKKERLGLYAYQHTRVIKAANISALTSFPRIRRARCFTSGYLLQFQERAGFREDTLSKDFVDHSGIKPGLSCVRNKRATTAPRPQVRVINKRTEELPKPTKE